MLLLCGFR